MQKVDKNDAFAIIASILLGYLCYVNLIIGQLNSALPDTLSKWIKILINACILISCVLLIYSIRFIAYRKKISKSVRAFLWIVYLGVLIFFLFVTSNRGNNIILNPLKIIFEIFDDGLNKIAIGNIILFLPIGYMLRRYKFLESLIVAILLELTIELMQYSLSLGGFNICDIIFNLIGIYMGYCLFKSSNPKRRKKDKGLNQ